MLPSPTLTGNSFFLDSTPPSAVTEMTELWMLFTGVQGLPEGPPRVGGTEADKAGGPESRGGPEGRSCTPVNKHSNSWVFSGTTRGDVDSRNGLFYIRRLFNERLMKRLTHHPSHREGRGRRHEVTSLPHLFRFSMKGCASNSSKNFRDVFHNTAKQRSAHF